jgi:hypothetical protein
MPTKKPVAAELRKITRERHRARLVAAIQVYSRTMPEWYAKHTAEITNLMDDAPLNAHATEAMVEGHQAWRRVTELPPLIAPKDWTAAAVEAGASDDVLLAIETGEPDGLRLLVSRLVAWAQRRQDEITIDDVPRPASEIADRHGLTTRQVEGFTTRGRMKYGPSCYIESNERGARQAKYLYRETYFRDEIRRAKDAKSQPSQVRVK